MDIKSTYQIETIKAQCKALENKGFTVTLNFYKLANEQLGHVILVKNGKSWRFSDPDLNIIITQICMLNASLNKNPNIFYNFSNIFKG